LLNFPQLKGLSIKQQAEHLKQWSIASFIPYKFYYDEASAIDPNAIEMIARNAGLFGDWLFDNLDAILNEDDIYTNKDVVKNIREQLRINQV
jgi:hypothetical protein